MARFTRFLLASLISVLAVLLAAVPALAAEFRSGGAVDVAKGEVVNGDLYAAGGDISIDGTVNGDLLVFGGTVNINGTINGAVMVAGGTVNINGTVARSVRAAGGNLFINGNIGGDLVIAGGTVSVLSGARIGKDLVLAAGTSRVDGQTEGNVKAAGGEVTLAGGIKGNVEANVDKLTLAGAARIEGNLLYTSDNEVIKEAGSQVRGATTQRFPPERRTGPLANLGFRIAGFVMAFIVGLVAVVIAPRKLENAADAIRTRPWPNLGWGALALFAVPLAAVIAMITIIGIPLALMALALWGMGLYFSQVPVALVIGRSLLGYFGKPQSKALLLAALAFGLIILNILQIVPVLGFLITLGVLFFGLGALILPVIYKPAPPDAAVAAPGPAPAPRQSNLPL